MKKIALIVATFLLLTGCSGFKSHADFHIGLPGFVVQKNAISPPAGSIYPTVFYTVRAIDKRMNLDQLYDWEQQFHSSSHIVSEGFASHTITRSDEIVHADKTPGIGLSVSFKKLDSEPDAPADKIVYYYVFSTDKKHYRFVANSETGFLQIAQSLEFLE